ncbi:MAG: hypothetical protein ACRDOV_11725, partial [Streptomyces sp.]
MADRGGPVHGHDPGQQWQGGGNGRPQRPGGRYDYGVANDRDDYGDGRSGYPRDYGYSEPFDYVGPPAGPAGEASGETMRLGRPVVVPDDMGDAPPTPTEPRPPTGG